MSTYLHFQLAARAGTGAGRAGQGARGAGQKGSTNPFSQHIAAAAWGSRPARRAAIIILHLDFA